MCHIAGLGCQVWKEKVAVDPVTIKVAEHFGIDWLRLISSGCMLIVAPERKKEQIMSALQIGGIEVSCIGKVCEKEKGLYLVDEERQIEIAPPEADELYKVVK